MQMLDLKNYFQLSYLIKKWVHSYIVLAKKNIKIIMMKFKLNMLNIIRIIMIMNMKEQIIIFYIKFNVNPINFLGFSIL